MGEVGWWAALGFFVVLTGVYEWARWWKVDDLKAHLEIRKKHIDRLLAENAYLRDELDGIQRGTCEPVEELKTDD